MHNDERSHPWLWQSVVRAALACKLQTQSGEPGGGYFRLHPAHCEPRQSSRTTVSTSYYRSVHMKTQAKTHIFTDRNETNRRQRTTVRPAPEEPTELDLPFSKEKIERMRISYFPQSTPLFHPPFFSCATWVSSAHDSRTKFQDVRCMLLPPTFGFYRYISRSRRTEPS